MSCNINLPNRNGGHLGRRFYSIISPQPAPVAVFQQFRLYNAARNKPICAFVEGEADIDYFRGEIVKRARTAVRFIVCNGKDGVLQAARTIAEKHGSATNTLFFVDKDFEDYLQCTAPKPPRVFTTSFYSIENHLVGEIALHVILCENGHLAFDDPRAVKLFQRYADQLKRFCMNLRRFIACAIACKRKNIRVNLNNVDLKRAFRLTDDFELSKRENYAETLRTMADVPVNAVSIDELKDELRRLRLGEFKKWLRGKYELWFFVKFIDLACQKLSGTQVDSGRRFTRLVALTEANAFQILSDRVTSPAELRSFLDQLLS